MQRINRRYGFRSNRAIGTIGKESRFRAASNNSSDSQIDESICRTECIPIKSQDAIIERTCGSVISV